MIAQLDGASWDVADAAALVAAIDAELGEVKAAAKDLVAKGRLDQREADYRVAVITDIREDLLHAFAPIGEGELRNPHDSRVTWSDKVRWINTELRNRQERYPELVAKGRLTAEEARRRIRAIAQLRRLYWKRMFQWLPPEGPALEYLRASRAAAFGGAKVAVLNRSEGRKIYQELVRAHMAELEREEAGEAQLPIGDAA